MKFRDRKFVQADGIKEVIEMLRKHLGVVSDSKLSLSMGYTRYYAGRLIKNRTGLTFSFLAKASQILGKDIIVETKNGNHRVFVRE